MTIENSGTMGGNCSFNKEWVMVLDEKRSHVDTGFRICGYKVVFYGFNSEQVKNILNSNTPDTTYLIATMNKKSRILHVENVNVFKGHDLNYEINIEYDNEGKLIPYNTKFGTHSHYWQKDQKTGDLKRERHQKGNLFPVKNEYNELLILIEKFNKKKNKYNV